MPVCLQPRAPHRFRIVRAEDKRPVRQSWLGYHLRPHGHYQLEIAVAGDSDEPCSLSVVAGPLCRANDQTQRLADDGYTVTRYDVQFVRHDDAARLPGCWWSRLEPLVVRLEYGDGREDCEQTLRLIVTPRRLWALLALISTAVLYGLVPWLSRRILDEGNLSTAWAQVLELLARPAVWQGLMLVIAAVWFAIVLSDRIHIWLRAHHRRREIRREVQRYTNALP
ncbi:MAG: hypothetical protein KJ000_21175 [Pirellulaceae bacterium]|nr:hypothetical protein [Pirellulaceae bacterium]